MVNSRRYGQGSYSDQCGAPIHPCPKSHHERQIARLDLSRPGAFVPKKWNRCSRSVSILLDIVDHLLIRYSKGFLNELIDPAVGLVHEDHSEVVDLDPVTVQDLARHFCHQGSRCFEDIP